MKASIATRLAVMFAVAALGVFSLVGFALQRVLHRELDSHQLSEVNTRLEYASMMISKNESVERWQGIRSKLDALTPPTGSARFWVLCPDPRFEYGDPLEDLRERLSPQAEGPFVIDLGDRSTGCAPPPRAATCWSRCRCCWRPCCRSPATSTGSTPA